MGIAATAALAGPAAAAAEAPSECPGDPINPDEVITGEFSAKRQGSFVFLPFDVPDDKTQVRVKYCHDQPESPTSAQVRHTLDLGLYEPRDRSDDTGRSTSSAAGEAPAITTRVIGGSGTQLVVLKDNVSVLAVPVVGGDFSFPFDSLGPGRYLLQVQRTSSIEAVSSPIYLKPGAEPDDRVCGPFVVE